MAEQIEQEQEEHTDATETDATEEKVTGSNQKQKQTFTFEEHTAEVKRIVAKEKQSWKRTQEKASADHETIVEGLRVDITKRDEIIKTNIDLLKKDLQIDEEDWELTMADRDVLEQYQYLLKKVEKSSKKDAEYPRTPKGKQREPEFTTSFKANV